MKVIVLCGIPGSGKSTFSKKYNNYKRINQDELGSRYQCLSLFRTLLSKGKNVIIDRCNINKMQRTLWLTVAKEYDMVKEISCINLVIEPEEALRRIIERKGHETIKEDVTPEKVKEIITNFMTTYEKPDLEEGFDKVLHIKVKNDD